MKSKRVYLENTENNTTMTELIKNLRSKYISCDRVNVTLEDERKDNTADNIENAENIDPNRQDKYYTPMVKSIKELKCEIFQAKPVDSEETNEVTEEKNYPWLHNQIEDRLVGISSSAKIMKKSNPFLNMLNKPSSKTTDANERILTNFSKIDELNKRFCLDSVCKWISEPNSEQHSSDSGIDENSHNYYEDEESELESQSQSFLEREASKIFKGVIHMQKISFKKMCNIEEDYVKFGLKLNTDPIVSPSNQTHKFLPGRYKNDENYKVRLFKYLRKPQNAHNKTETCKFMQYRKFSQAFDGNMSNYYSTLGMKKRKVSSERKVYEAEHVFEDNSAYHNPQNKSPQYFRFYSDKDIGFSSKWQIQLKSTEMDDDVETDDDQLGAAGRHILREIGDGVKTYVKNRKNVRNISLLKLF